MEKTAWVSSDLMTMPKYTGGMGFRDIEIENLLAPFKPGGFYKILCLLAPGC